MEHFAVSTYNYNMESLVSWNKLLLNYVKINSDGSSWGNPRLAVVGGLLWDGSGSWFVGFTSNLGICSSIQAEI